MHPADNNPVLVLAAAAFYEKSINSVVNHYQIRKSQNVCGTGFSAKSAEFLANVKIS